MFDLFAEPIGNGFRVTQFYNGAEMEIAKFRSLKRSRMHCSFCCNELEDNTYWIVIEKTRSSFSDWNNHHYHLHVACALNKNSIILSKDQIECIKEHLDELLMEEL
jgi:hypothetical protein